MRDAKADLLEWQRAQWGMSWPRMTALGVGRESVEYLEIGLPLADGEQEALVCIPCWRYYSGQWPWPDALGEFSLLCKWSWQYKIVSQHTSTPV